MAPEVAETPEMPLLALLIIFGAEEKTMANLKLKLYFHCSYI